MTPARSFGSALDLGERSKIATLGQFGPTSHGMEGVGCQRMLPDGADEVCVGECLANGRPTSTGPARRDHLAEELWPAGRCETSRPAHHGRSRDICAERCPYGELGGVPAWPSRSVAGDRLGSARAKAAARTAMGRVSSSTAALTSEWRAHVLRHEFAEDFERERVIGQSAEYASAACGRREPPWNIVARCSTKRQPARSSRTIGKGNSQRDGSGCRRTPHVTRSAITVATSDVRARLPASGDALCSSRHDGRSHGEGAGRSGRRECAGL